MPEMTLPYDHTLRSLSGRSVEFKANEPTYVVPELVAEAEALGAVDVDKQTFVVEGDGDQGQGNGDQGQGDGDQGQGDGAQGDAGQ